MEDVDKMLPEADSISRAMNEDLKLRPKRPRATNIESSEHRRVKGKGTEHQKDHLQSQVDADRCIYVSNLPKCYPAINFENFVRNRCQKLNNNGSKVNACLVRMPLGDALVEFETADHANLALNALNGTCFSTCHIRVMKMNPIYISSFLSYIRSLPSGGRGNGKKHACTAQRMDKSKIQCAYKMKQQQACVLSTNHQPMDKLNAECGKKKASMESNYHPKGFSPSKECLKAKMFMLAKENAKLGDFHAALVHKKKTDRYAILSLEEENASTRRKLEAARDENDDLRERLKHERSRSRRNERELEDRLVALQDQNDSLRHTGRTHRNESQHKESAIEKLKQKVYQSQCDNENLKKELALSLVTGQIESLLGKAMEENDDLRDQLEQMEMNHALEMGSAQGSSSTVENLQQELALAKEQIHEFESQCRCARTKKEEQYTNDY